MIKFQFKVYLAIIFACIVGFTFFYLNHTAQRLLISHSEVIHQLSDIDLYNEQINKEILNSTFRLYNTYDKVNFLIQKIRNAIQSVNKNSVMQDVIYLDIRDKLDQFSQELDRKEKAIQKFSTLNSMIKNSATYIPTLTTRYLKRFGYQDKQYLLELSKITSSIFLAHNAMDADLLGTIKESLDYLQSKQFTDQEKNSFNQLFLSHSRVMIRYMPLYLSVFNEINESLSNKLIHRIENDFINISSIQATKLSTMSYIVMIAFLTSILLIIYLLFDVDKSRKKQVQLHQQLEKRATTDSLTGLGSRFSFQQIEQNLDDNWTLLLINIDGFKHINDFYGRQIGDLVLKHMAKIIESFKSTINYERIYRVGTDDFAILIEKNNTSELTLLVQQLIQGIGRKFFTYHDIHLLIQASIGISNKAPLLETADIALRQIKNTRKKYMFYDKEQALESQIESNLTMMQFIQEAIEFDYIIPHFMPLMSNKDNKIIAYECLIRLQDKSGKLYFPNEFLPVAKKGRLYGKLTQIMISKCMKKFIDTDYLFSINISMEDIEDNEVTDYIFKKLEQLPDVGKRLTFEILESEDVSNYEKLQNFVDKIKSYGCKISIDDYGSGYSNLQHLVQLQVDSLKLDGSLIEPMIQDRNNIVAVHAIVDMAKDLKIASTTAEYVSSEAILKLVKASNITYSQGYFIGKASTELITQPEFLQDHQND
ncbi:MAG: EAL domain-containing protein [Pseudomonadota bacterium]